MLSLPRVHPARVELREGVGQEVGLLLVVAFQGHPIPGLQHGVQQVHCGGRLDLLAAGATTHGRGGTLETAPSTVGPVGPAARFDAHELDSPTSSGRRLSSSAAATS